jgi:hypothetical protein
MNEIYQRVRERARQIVACFPQQRFYLDHQEELIRSRQLLETDSTVIEVREMVVSGLGDNLGHGLEHAEKVTIDAGALILAERSMAGAGSVFAQRQLVLVQCCGLLHDIKRSHKSHARIGAEYARELLTGRPDFHPDEIEDIFNAICNHEAFQCQMELKTPAGILMSDCLYDADKFRWGPDNFTHTVWDMLAKTNTPFSVFVKLYPRGMKGLAKIRDTFRTATGKKYGPQFIDTGLDIGEELYQVITSEFVDYF